MSQEYFCKALYELWVPKLRKYVAKEKGDVLLNTR